MTTKDLSRTEYSTRKSGLVGAILKMHRFETYRRTERISYPSFTCHFSFQSITGINLHSRLGGEDLHLTPACWIIHPGSRPCIISFRIQFPSMIISVYHLQLGMIRIYTFSDSMGIRKSRGVPATGRYSPVTHFLSSYGVKRSASTQSCWSSTLFVKFPEILKKE